MLLCELCSMLCFFFICQRKWVFFLQKAEKSIEYRSVCYFITRAPNISWTQGNKKNKRKQHKKTIRGNINKNLYFRCNWKMFSFVLDWTMPVHVNSFLSSIKFKYMTKVNAEVVDKSTKHFFLFLFLNVAINVISCSFYSR